MSYIEENRGFITASKLKMFIKNPEEYKLKYIDEIEIDEDKRCFFLGTAFDDLVSYGREKFFEKYFIDEGFLVDELKEKLINDGFDPSKVKAMKLPELRANYYKEGQKLRLTDAEGRDIIGMYKEASRQPALDLGGKYEKQHKIECEYKGIKLKGTLDRFDKENATIRDRKTSGRIDNFAYDMENTFDYVLQMAFYFTLAKVKYGIDCNVYLDVIGKSSPYPSVSYTLSNDTLFEKLTSTIKPALDFYIECLKTNTRPAINAVTKCPVNRFDTMKSPYYPHMTSSIMNNSISPNEY